jgi:hypothetical protein
MKMRLPASLFALSLTWGADLSAGEARHGLADGRFGFAVPADWLHIGSQTEGPRQFAGFMVTWGNPAAPPGNVSVLSFCKGSEAEAKRYLDSLKAEAREQDAFTSVAEGAAGRFDRMGYSAKQGGDAFVINDYYLLSGACGIQLRFAAPAGEQGGFEAASQGVLDSLQVQ